MNKVTDVLNGISILTILATLAGILPPVAALVGIIYYGILIWESKTVREWRQLRRLRLVERYEVRLAKLRPKQPAPPSNPEA